LALGTWYFGKHFVILFLLAFYLGYLVCGWFCLDLLKFDWLLPWMFRLA